MMTDEHMGIEEKSGLLLENLLEYFPDPLVHCIGFKFLSSDEQIRKTGAASAMLMTSSQA